MLQGGAVHETLLEALLGVARPAVPSLLVRGRLFLGLALERREIDLGAGLVALLGDSIKEKVARDGVDRAGSVLLPALLLGDILELGHQVVNLGLSFPAARLLFDRRALELDHAGVGEPHERRREVLRLGLAPVIECAEHGGVIARRNIAEIRLLELGGRLVTLLHPGGNDSDGRHDGKANGAERADVACHEGALAPGVGLVRPRALLRENGIELRAGGLLAGGHPRSREGHTHLRILVGADARDGEDHVVHQERHLGVERAVAPGADVAARRDGLTRDDGKMQRAGNVLRLHVPAVRDELPVELARVLPARGHIRELIDDGEGGRLVLMGGIELDPRVRRVLGQLVCAAVAGLGERELVHPGTRALSHGVDNELDFLVVVRVVARGDLPVHPVEAAVKIERARLFDAQGAVLGHRGVDVHLRDRVVAGECRCRHSSEGDNKGDERREAEPAGTRRAESDNHMRLHLR